MIVVDTTVVYAWAMENHVQHRRARAAIRKARADYSLPPLWRTEFRSAALRDITKEILTLEDARRAFRLAEKVFGPAELGVETAAVLRSAIDFDLSAYDAEFMALAEELGCQVLTGDYKSFADRIGKYALRLDAF